MEAKYRAKSGQLTLNNMRKILKCEMSWGVEDVRSPRSHQDLGLHLNGYLE